MSVDEQMDKLDVVFHTVEYDSVLKRRSLLTPATAWTNLKDVVLSEISHHRRDNTIGTA